MSKRKNNKAIFLQTTEKLTLEELAERVSQLVDHDDAAFFIAPNVSGIAEGRDLEHESFTLAQMPNRTTND
jgi:hypothetical protein